MQTSLVAAAQTTPIEGNFEIEDVYLKKGKPAPWNGTLVDRQNYQFYQERVETSYRLQQQINDLTNNPAPKIDFETSLVTVSIGLLVGVFVGGIFFSHH